eukprot:TRINITY_DN3223_c0_g1_i4.p1 TRINITY_DN3223_c0_g1~~TRINITY_DN3223_c0_g1_i4.p1  ORF type:complete len:101 (-),score=18.61 TRINITY_DN3223_c0_g1_i4:233-535(-)
MERKEEPAGLRMAPLRPQVKNVDMKDDMLRFATEVTTRAFEQHNREKDIAAAIRAEFDSKLGKTWNVIVGKHYGSAVTHETKRYVSLQVGNHNIVIWKSG